VDPRQIERVLYSLAANAREAMPDGGTLVVETFDIDLSVRGGGELGLVPGPYAALSVVDSGSGMSEETLARAFQPFYTTRRGAERTGLGLTNAMLVVSHYGGTIRIDSQLGKGTTVAVYLPRAEAKVVDTAPAGSVEDTLRLRSFVSRLAGRMS
jgi:signal transduction histidine kinase